MTVSHSLGWGGGWLTPLLTLLLVQVFKCKHQIKHRKDGEDKSSCDPDHMDKLDHLYIHLNIERNSPGHMDLLGFLTTQMAAFSPR